MVENDVGIEDLMKKGLRQQTADTLTWRLRRNRRPDEEGIKTRQENRICLDTFVGIEDLMKKGFRQHRGAIRDIYKGRVN